MGVFARLSTNIDQTFNSPLMDSFTPSLSQTSSEACEMFRDSVCGPALADVTKNATNCRKDSGFWDTDSQELESGEIDGGTGLLIITLEEVESHCTREDGWCFLTRCTTCPLTCLPILAV